jgi:hypothetical protein
MKTRGPSHLGAVYGVRTDSRESICLKGQRGSETMRNALASSATCCFGPLRRAQSVSVPPRLVVGTRRPGRERPRYVCAGLDQKLCVSADGHPLGTPRMERGAALLPVSALHSPQIRICTPCFLECRGMRIAVWRARLFERSVWFGETRERGAAGCGDRGEPGAVHAAYRRDHPGVHEHGGWRAAFTKAAAVSASQMSQIGLGAAKRRG